MPKWYGGYILNDTEFPKEEWKFQWARVKRWYERTKQIRVRSENNYEYELNEYEFDDLIAFFQNCFHLRDWILVCRPDLKRILDDFFTKHFEMRGCRDICNGFKHKKLTAYPLDADFNIVRIYDHLENMGSKGTKNPIKYNIAFADGDDLRVYNIFDFVEKCYQLWKDFISKGKQQKKNT